MFKCNFSAYEGNDKFIFISYAHKDSDMVYPIIERLNAEGYRVWYDDGITPGSEWPENIADHLDRCETFVFFASPNSVSSDNCKREVNFALSRKKKFFTISLVPTEFSLGLELQISTQQNILFYEYSDIVKFYDTLFLASSLADCKIPEQKIEEPAPAVSSEPVKSEPVITESVKAETIAAEPTYEQNVFEEKPKKSKKGLVIGLIVGGAVLVGVIAIGLLSVLGITFGVLSSKVKFSEYNQYEKNETYVSFYGDTVDSDFMKKLSKLKKLESVSFSECTFADGVDLSSLPACSTINSVYITNCKISDYSFLEKMPALSSININGGSFAGVDSFASQDMDIVYLTNVSDVSLSAFSPCTGIYSFKLTDCTLVEDNIVPLPDTISTLVLSGCNLSDSTFLEESGLDNLVTLDLSNNNLTDVCFISNSYSGLMTLDLSYNPIDMASLSVVQNCFDLTELNLSGIHFDDLSIVGQMRDLEILNLSDCGISDLSNGNLQAKDMDILILSNNNISSLEPLKDLYISDNEFEHINLSHNPITSFDGLPEQIYYEDFIAYDTQIIGDPSQALKYLSTCSFDTVAINYIDGVENLKINDNLYIIDCPHDVNVTASGDSTYYLDVKNTMDSFDITMKEKYDYSFIF